MTNTDTLILRRTASEPGRAPQAQEIFMTCDCDITDVRIELENQLAVDAIRRRVKGKRELLPNGTCNNPDCQLPVLEDQIFCNSECATEYEQLKAAGLLPFRPRLPKQ